jgi:hypothetical protein
VPSVDGAMSAQRCILVDCDGVIANMTHSVLQLARDKANVFDKGEEDITAWDYGASLGWPGVNHAIDEAVLHHEFVYRMVPFAGAFAALRRLEARFGKDNVLVCTSPWCGEWAAQRYAWLKDFADVDHGRVIMCKQKHRIPGFLIDDCVDNFRYRNFNDSFLIARPHNAGSLLTRGTLDEAVERAVSWGRE